MLRVSTVSTTLLFRRAETLCYQSVVATTYSPKAWLAAYKSFSTPGGIPFRRAASSRHNSLAYGSPSTRRAFFRLRCNLVGKESPTHIENSIQSLSGRSGAGGGRTAYLDRSYLNSCVNLPLLRRRFWSFFTVSAARSGASALNSVSSSRPRKIRGRM